MHRKCMFTWPARTHQPSPTQNRFYVSSLARTLVLLHVHKPHLCGGSVPTSWLVCKQGNDNRSARRRHASSAMARLVAHSSRLRLRAARGGKPDCFVVDMFFACCASCLHRLLALAAVPHYLGRPRAHGSRRRGQRVEQVRITQPGPAQPSPAHDPEVESMCSLKSCCLLSVETLFAPASSARLQLSQPSQGFRV